MTTATVETKTYKTFTWQAVKKMADAMGVQFYSHSSHYIDKGLGLKLGYYDKKLIHIEGYERTHGDNEYTRDRVRTLGYENFMLKLELWALKNGITYEIKEIKRSYGGVDLELRIVEKVGA